MAIQLTFEIGAVTADARGATVADAVQGLDPAVLAAAERCVYSANADVLLHRDGARVAYLTSADRADAADTRALAPGPVVGVAERTDFRGRTVIALTDAAIADAVAQLRALAVDAVALCLPWSFLAPAHERRLVAALRRELPDVYVSASVDVAPMLGQRERGATTILNASLGPALAAHLDELEGALRGAGLRAPLLLRTAAGTVLSAAETRARPLGLLESAPADTWRPLHDDEPRAAGPAGDPLRRVPALVAADHAAGRITAADAHGIHGVVIDDGDLDELATAACRRDRRRARLAGAVPASVLLERHGAEGVLTALGG